MKKFTITFVQNHITPLIGEVEIEANSELEAMGILYDNYSDYNSKIEWECSGDYEPTNEDFNIIDIE